MVGRVAERHRAAHEQLSGPHLPRRHRVRDGTAARVTTEGGVAFARDPIDIRVPRHDPHVARPAVHGRLVAQHPVQRHRVVLGMGDEPRERIIDRRDGGSF